MPGIFGDDFLSLLSPLATAQYRPTPSATFPDPAAPPPGPLSIPPAEPPIFFSPPDAAGVAPAQPGNALGGIANAIGNGVNNHALTLMALGAGIAQGGVGRGLADATTAAAAERNRQAQQLNLLQTYNALTGAGVPEPQARAAIGNPNLTRALAAKYLGPRAPGTTAAAPMASPNTPTMPGNAPTPPPNVAKGAAYSLSRGVWRNPDGSIFDQNGKPVP